MTADTQNLPAALVDAITALHSVLPAGCNETVHVSFATDDASVIDALHEAYGGSYKAAHHVAWHDYEQRYSLQVSYVGGPVEETTA